MSKEKALKEIEEYYDLNNWEEVPGEELYEDGELDGNAVRRKLYRQICVEGNYRVIRRK